MMSQLKDPLVSVVIPIYNVEKYLRRCIDSVVGQSYKNLEIVLVDDGSTDRSARICDEFSQLDDRIKTIHKANGGLSSARNTGIESANGAYISFVDGDDILHQDFIKDLLDAIRSSGKKMSVCLFKHFSDNKPLLFDFQKKISTSLSVKESIESYCEMTPAKSTAFISCCTKLYDKSLFDAVKFPQGKIYEDGLISFKLIDLADGVAFVGEPLYGYYMRNDSIMGVKESHSYESVFEPYKNAIEYFKSISKKDVAELFYPPLLMREIYRYWVAKIVQKDEIISLEILQILRSDYRHMINGNCSIKAKVLFGMISKIPWLYCLYRKIAPGLVGGR